MDIDKVLKASPESIKFLDNESPQLSSKATIGHPHWYSPDNPNNLNENIPKVSGAEVRDAYYKASRNLNTVVENKKSMEGEQKTPPIVPLWVDRYDPPESSYNGEMFSLSRSQLAESILHLHGNKFRFNRWNERKEFEDRRYLVLIYNIAWPKVIFMCGRQVEKTQTLCNITVTSSIASPYYKTVYVSPSIIQTSTFSSEKLSPAINDSPLVRDYFINSKCRTQIFDKSFANGSYIFLRSAYHNADRARGISAHFFAGDEIQDQIPSNLEVISECLSHAAYPKWVYACTPKSMDNTASIYWERSRKGEWFVPCMAHGTPKNPESWYWQPLGMENVGDDFLMCRKCKKQIDPRYGRWEWTGNPNAEWAGFRISQLMAPWIPWKTDPSDPNAPDSIMNKVKSYSKVRLYNEVLGLPYDDAEKPMTRGVLHDCCDQDFKNTSANLVHYHKRGMRIFKGVDWGTKTDKSWTCSADVVYDNNKWRVIYAHRYEGAAQDYSVCLPQIQKEIEKYATVAGCDHGIGFAQNDILSFNIHGRRHVPVDNRRIYGISYAGNQNSLMKWNEQKEIYTLYRTGSLNDLFQMMHRNEIIFPCFEDMHSPFFTDILNIHKEASTSHMKGTNILYSLHPELTDDWAHALNFAIQAGKRFYKMI